MTEAFTRRDWGLLAAVALMWGSSFLLIEIGLVDLEPATVAWLRIVFGALTLACIPGARRGVRRGELPGIALLGLVWMAVPFLLFAVAQQSISSSLAGMINGAAPLFTVAVAAVWARRLPRGLQVVGLGVGFAGVLAINWPATQGAQATAVGAGLVLLATAFYGFAFNLAVPLEERSGVLPVIWRAQLVAAVLLAPPGVAGLAGSSPSWSGLLAVAALGAFSTGLAFVAFTTLASRVGAARGSVTVYFIPVVAIVLGVLLRDESVAAVSLFGTALVLLGAYLTSRRTRTG
ncbi:MAG TPA: DMT family transporter [Actinomycetales bacterium]|nr:DMT family transporter [Actinomycetales bacterium]